MDAADFVEVAAGTYDLEVRPAGTVYDVFAIGTLADGTLQALPLTAPASGVGAELPAVTEAQGAVDAAGEAVHIMPHTDIGADLASGWANWLAILSTLIAAVMGTLALRFRFSSR